MPKKDASRGPKYRQVHAALRRDIESGLWKPGNRLPSEAELVKKFGASRITVGRAVRELQLAGLVERRAGSGTFVKAPSPTRGLSFGLLIPDLGETEIFEPICQGMMASSLAREHALIWGSLNGGGTSKELRAWQLCRQYIDRRVESALDEAGIPIVLLDRTVLPYPERGRHDLVGIDNRRAGYVITEHLLRVGARRIAFVSLPHAAATVDARESGYREALYASGIAVERAMIQRLDPADEEAVERFVQAARPDAIVCANDRTAGRLMHTLMRRGRHIPNDVRLAGIDDVEYAGLLPVPLTTLRQPTKQIGDAALGAMLDRVARPDLPPRDILLQCELIVRQSCGAAL
jgi:DNA-binding LacI/PurR family transcriptional regulator